MSLALDTNVVQALLEKNHPFQSDAVAALKRWGGQQLIISPFVYAEAHGIPSFDGSTFASFLQATGILVDKVLPDTLWQRAGEAHAAYHLRRRQQGQTEHRRILTDFLIGAHALEVQAPLLTFDPKGYRTAFSKLELLP